MRAFLTGLAAGLLLTLSAATLQAQAAQNVQFQDWVVFCDDDNRCTTSTVDQNDAAGPFEISRSAAVQSLWEVSVATKTEAPSFFGPRSLRFAGQRLIQLTPNRDFASFNNPNVFYFINSSSFSPLFRRMISSRRLFLSFHADKGGRINASYSLKGLSSALLWIDKKQKKLGSKRLVGPPVVQQAKPTKNTVFDAAAIAEQKHQDTLDSTICNLTLERRQQIVSLTEPLDTQNFLIAIPCFATEINTSYRIFVVDAATQKARLQLFAIYSNAQGWVGTDHLSNVTYDPTSGTLSMIHKKDKNGHCGSTGTWQWRKNGFQMKTFQAKETCNGVSGAWPSVLNNR